MMWVDEGGSPEVGVDKDEFEFGIIITLVVGGVREVEYCWC